MTIKSFDWFSDRHRCVEVCFWDSEWMVIADDFGDVVGPPNRVAVQFARRPGPGGEGHSPKIEELDERELEMGLA